MRSSGSAIGTATAWALKFDKSELSAGIYGFNSALVGIATLFFFRPAVASIALLVGGCVVAALVTWLMRRYLPFPTYTTPFIVTTWALFFLGQALGVPRVEPGGPLVGVGFAGAVAHGVSQVMFQASIWTALLFLVGIALNDWRHASWVLVGLDRRHAGRELPFRFLGGNRRPGEPGRSRPGRERRAGTLRLQRDTGGRRPVPVEAVADSAVAGHAPLGSDHRSRPHARATRPDGTVRPGDLAGSGVRLARWKIIPRAGNHGAVTRRPRRR